MWLPLGAVNLLGMHIIPPLTLTAGTHLIYPQGNGGLSKPCSTDTGFPRWSPIQVQTRLMVA